MSEEILKVLEKLKNKSNYQRDCNDGSYFIELFANEIYILCKFMEDLQQKVEQLEKELNQEKEEYAGLHKVLNNKEEEFEKENYNNVVEISRLKRKVEQLENIRKEAIGYVTSYESISTIQGLDDIEKNKNLDEKTMNEMINRYLKVHDILLNILNKGSDKE